MVSWRVFHFPTVIHSGCTAAAPCRAVDRGLPSIVVPKQEPRHIRAHLDDRRMGLGRPSARAVRPASDAACARIPQGYPGVFFFNGRFSLDPFVTLLKQEYLRCQHNILCFILDTPHRGRYFHDCVTQASKRKCRAKGSKSRQRNSGRAVVLPAVTAKAPSGPSTPHYESKETGRPDRHWPKPAVSEAAIEAADESEI
jgi:hypothetical protein